MWTKAYYGYQYLTIYDEDKTPIAYGSVCDMGTFISYYVYSYVSFKVVQEGTSTDSLDATKKLVEQLLGKG